MMKTTNHILTNLTLATILGLTACASESDEQVDTTAHGVCAYDDAASGEPARPTPQPVTVSVEVEGTGELDLPEPECSLDGATGAFEGLITGEGRIDDDGAYVAGLASAMGVFATPSGCTIDDLQIGAVTDVVVRAEIAADVPNCNTYCAARARSYAESECGAGAGEANCRAAAEAEYEASCSVACTGETSYRLVAETSLSADAIAELNASSITGTALGDLQVALTFDRIETAEGGVVEEQ